MKNFFKQFEKKEPISLIVSKLKPKIIKTIIEEYLTFEVSLINGECILENSREFVLLLYE